MKSSDLRTQQEITNRKSQTYFDQTLKDYDRFWRLQKHGGMHSGYHESKRIPHDNAVLAMNSALADEAKIVADEWVLDAGCGVGGSAFWLSQQRKAKVVGLNLNQTQLSRAKSQARKGSDVEFVRGDFTQIPLAQNSFDVVWALESCCYSVERESFLGEAFRVTKPGGRLIVGDAFLKREPETDREVRLVRRWCEAWAVPSLPTIQQMEQACHNTGWSCVKTRDITTNVLPTSNRMLWLSLIFWPFGVLASTFGSITSVQQKALRGGLDQYRIRLQNMGCYSIVSAKKPV